MTPYQVAQRFIGIKEMPGHDMNTAMIMAFLQLDAQWPQDDEVPWCSGFVNWCHWFAKYPRTESLRARSWLLLGTPTDLNQAEPGDIVIFNRGGPQDPDIIEAPGHVGFYMSSDQTFIHTLGGNQSNQVKESVYPINDLLGIRQIDPL